MASHEIPCNARLGGPQTAQLREVRHSVSARRSRCLACSSGMPRSQRPSESSPSDDPIRRRRTHRRLHGSNAVSKFEGWRVLSAHQPFKQALECVEGSGVLPHRAVTTVPHVYQEGEDCILGGDILTGVVESEQSTPQQLEDELQQPALAARRWERPRRFYQSSASKTKTSG